MIELSKLNKLIDYLPAIFVVLISTAAFVPGFLQSGASETLETDQKLLEDLQNSYDFMIDQARYIFEYDSSIYTLMW